MRYDLTKTPTSPPLPGKRLLLMGLAKDGPVNTPIPVKTLQEAEDIFGSRLYGDLVKGFLQARLVPGITIYLMRITGEYARANLQATVGIEKKNVISIRSIAAGDTYNDIRIYLDKVLKDNVQKDALIFEIPKAGMISRGYLLEDYASLEELVREINLDTQSRKNEVFVTTSMPFLSPSLLVAANPKAIRMVGGHDGLTISKQGLNIQIPKDNLYLALENSYSLLVGQEYDIICPVSARFDDSHPAYFYGTAEYGNVFFASDDDYLALVDTEQADQLVTFHEQLIDFCRRQEAYGIISHGILGTREVKDLSDLTKHEYSYVAALAQATAIRNRYGLAYYKNGDWIDKGHYLSVWAHDCYFYQGTEYQFMANGHVLYAAMMAGMNDSETLVNKPLPAGVALRYELADDELEDLATLGISTARWSVKRGAVIAASVTTGLYDSALHHLPNIRMIQMTMSEVYLAMEDMVGGNYVPAVTEREMDRRMNTVLSQLVTRNVLRDYTLSINYKRAENQGYISLELLTKYAVEHVATSANMLFAQRGVV